MPSVVLFLLVVLAPLAHASGDAAPGGPSLPYAECRAAVEPSARAAFRDVRDADLSRRRELLRRVERDRRDLEALRRSLTAPERAYVHALALGLETAVPPAFSRRIEGFLERAFELRCSPGDRPLHPLRAVYGEGSLGNLLNYCHAPGVPMTYWGRPVYGERYRAAWESRHLVGFDRFVDDSSGETLHFRQYIDLETGAIELRELHFVDVGGHLDVAAFPRRLAGPDDLVPPVPPIAAYVEAEVERVCGPAPEAGPILSAAGRVAPSLSGETSDLRPWPVGDGTAGSVTAR